MNSQDNNGSKTTLTTAELTAATITTNDNMNNISHAFINCAMGLFLNLMLETY